MARVYYQRRLRADEFGAVFDRQFNAEQILPLFGLVFVVRGFLNQLRGGGFGEFPHRGAPTGAQDEFFLKPNFLLKVFQLCEEVNYLPRQFAQHAHMPEPRLGDRPVGAVQVVQPQHFVFNEEIQFAAQECAQVLMHEIIKVVFGGERRQMFVQQCALFVLFGRHRRGEQFAPLLRGEVDDFLRGFFVDGVLFFAVAADAPKAHRQFAAFFRNRVFIGERITAVCACFVVVGFGGGALHGKNHAPAAGQSEGVSAEGFGGFDVILVGVRPVQFDFLAFVGKGVDIFLVAAQTEEVALAVIPAEEVAQIGKHAALALLFVAALRLQALFDFLHFRRIVRLNARDVGGFGDGFQFVAQKFRFVGVVFVQQLARLRQEVALQKRANLRAFDVEDAVDAKIQVAAVQLKDFLQFGEQLLSHFGAHLIPQPSAR